MNNLVINLTQQLDIQEEALTNSDLCIIMVHGADGSIASFYPLARLLNCVMYAIPFNFDFVQECHTTNAFAKIYWQHAKDLTHGKRCFLAGYSYGGLVAYEMSKLALQENRVDGLFMLDPNLPLTMRKYEAKRTNELRILVKTILPSRLINQHEISRYSEQELLNLLQQYVQLDRIEFILSARKHCLHALRLYDEDLNFNEMPTKFLHAKEKLDISFVDEETKWISEGEAVSGNHFTMLNPMHVGEIATIINSSVEECSPLAYS